MRILILLPLLWCIVVQAQPVLINLNNGTTGQALIKSSNTSCDYAWTTLTKTMVGLPNADNTSDATKNSASAVLTTKTIATFNYAADAGSNDTYVISLSPSPGAYTTGMIIFFKANTVNTGAASINVNGLGAKTIVKRVSTALANGDIPALSFKMIIYDGTNFVLINPVVN